MQHVFFLSTGLLFWWPVVQPWPSRLRWPQWAMIPYLLFADIQNTALSAFLIFSERVLYPTYAAVPRLWGITALDDQAAAGAIMWVPGSVIFLIPVAVLAIRLLDSPRTRSVTTNKVSYEAVKGGTSVKEQNSDECRVTRDEGFAPRHPTLDPCFFCLRS